MVLWGISPELIFSFSRVGLDLGWCPWVLGCGFGGFFGWVWVSGVVALTLKWAWVKITTTRIWTAGWSPGFTFTRATHFGIAPCWPPQPHVRLGGRCGFVPGQGPRGGPGLRGQVPELRHLAGGPGEAGAGCVPWADIFFWADFAGGKERKAGDKGAEEPLLPSICRNRNILLICFVLSVLKGIDFTAGHLWFSPVGSGFQANLSLLDIFLCLPGDLRK